LKQERIEEAITEHHIQPPAKFLELGCGAGNIALWMASRGYSAYGVDIVPEAIRWAKEKATQSGLPAKFFIANLCDMRVFSDQRFDIVFDGDCFHMIIGTERDAYFREVFRVLRPGGLFIAGGNVRDETVRECITFIGGKGSFNPQSRQIVTPDGLKYLLCSETELCDEICRAGFKIVCVKHYQKRGGQRFVKECIIIHATKHNDTISV
jgi:ubiquinone/menaquinone biosynthesis C-methylase UbiE